MTNILLVGLGGGIGSITRYLVSIWASQKYGSEFPYGTMLVNLAGCLIIGLFMQLFADRIIVNPYWRMLVTVGFLGGLTTFSSFSYETVKLMGDGEMALAFYNAAANTILGLIATWIGIAIAKTV